MSDSFFPLILLTVVTSALLIGFSNKLQQANNQQRKTFNNDYIPPKSPLDIPVRTVPRHVPSIMEPNHTDDINGKNIVHREAPEKGYVVLNGIKRRIHECKDL
ncbi:MAG: hypothetical protein HXL52_01245 [Solobacterium sp.]|jgi:hypothetical protein|nr:hypothetical protein [Solobacterium sp.]